MIALALLGSALCAEPVAHAVGLGVGLNAWQSPARHILLPSPSLWVERTARPWSMGAELSWTHRASQTSLYDYGTHYARLSALGGLALGTRPATFHAEAGLALSAQLASVDWQSDAQTHLIAEPGLRIRLSMDGPIAERLAWQGLIGVTSRGVVDWDYDIAFGLGMRW